MKRILKAFTLIIGLGLLLNGCVGGALWHGTPATSPSQAPTPTMPPMATVTLNAHFPPGEGKYTVAQLDEVTGLSINPIRYPMQKNGNEYQAVLRVPRGTVLKYRYERHAADGSVHLERLTNGRLSRYRLAVVNGDMVLTDTVARWDDTTYHGATGWVFGKITDDKGHPIPDVIVTAAGMRAFSLADGSYRLEGVPTGIHNLVAYAPDGKYAPFQHLVEVGQDTATQANITLHERPMVQVRFVVDVPAETPQGAPVRLAGNLLGLGNTFGDVGGGLSALASLMPVMRPVAPHKYALTLTLPAGAYLRYKYTLGDGFWNAERDAQGKFVLRSVIVPPHDAVFTDQAVTWRAGASQPAWFEVSVPPETPKGEITFIQFNPVVWTTPLPMWYMGNHRWGYPLYGPTDIAEKMGYRYCRAGQCNAAISAGKPRVYSASGAREYRDSIQWRWWHGLKTTAAAVAPHPKTANFWQGVAFMPSFSPNWGPLIPKTMAEIRSMNANTVVFTPTWTATWSNPPFWEPQPPNDPLARDLLTWSKEAHRNGLLTVIYPKVRFNQGMANWWNASPTTFPWWQEWFDRYQKMAVHFGILAQESGATALVLGGEWVTPAILGRALPNGRLSGVPADADARWQGILQAVRKVYSGAVYWAMPLEEAQNPPKFVSAFDGVYLLWNLDLGGNKAAWETATANALTKYAKTAFQVTNKPIVLAVRYPSAKGARGGCLPTNGGCLAPSDLYPASAQATQIATDLNAQTKAYASLLRALAHADFINGLISADFYPPIPLQDPSASVHGKPAEAMLKSWFGGNAKSQP